MNKLICIVIFLEFSGVILGNTTEKILNPTIHAVLMPVFETKKSNLNSSDVRYTKLQTKLSVAEASLKIKEDISNFLAYKLKYDFANNLFEASYIKLSTDAFEFYLGQNTTFQGGLETQWKEIEWMVFTPYLTNNRPFTEYEPMFIFALKQQSFKLAILNDKTGSLDTTDTAFGMRSTSYKLNGLPTLMFDWQPKWEFLSPLIQGGIYDNAKSYNIEMSIRLNLNKLLFGVGGSFDYRSVTMDDSSKNHDILTNYVAMSSYEFMTDWIGMVKYGVFERSIAHNNTTGDQKLIANTSISKAGVAKLGESKFAKNYDQNANFWSLGLIKHNEESHLDTYFVLSGRFGEFYMDKKYEVTQSKSDLVATLEFKFEI